MQAHTNTDRQTDRQRLIDKNQAADESNNSKTVVEKKYLEWEIWNHRIDINWRVKYRDRAKCIDSLQ